MPSLLGSNYVDPPVSVRALARLAGVRGVVSVRELTTLLGDRRVTSTPLYIIAHGTNTIADVHAALDAGANAVEVDVTAYASNLNRLCVDHAGLTGDAPADDDAPRFEDFLRGLRFAADTRPALALVVFDCKPPAATPEHGQRMVDALRNFLTGGTDLNVILSVSDVTSSHPFRLDGTSLFDRILPTLNARESVMIDAQDEPDAVAAYFDRHGASHCCYGNGTSFPLSDEGAMVYRTPIERACWLRATRLGPRFVEAWTVNDLDDQRLYLRIGVDGIIVDVDHVPGLVRLSKTSEFAARYRLAARSDHPFLPGNSCYALTVRTSDVGMAGTDAKVTFTVTGEKGTSSTTTDTRFNRRMERGLSNYLVLPSPDLGELKSVSVRRDDSGNAADWHLASVTVESLTYRSRKTASFDCWVDTTDSFTRLLE